MAFRSPITKLSQLIADKLVAKDNQGHSVTLDPNSFVSMGGPTLLLETANGSNTATAFVREQAYGDGTSDIGIGTLNPDGSDACAVYAGSDNIALNGPVRFNENTGDNNVTGLTGGSDSIAFDASGNGEIAHGLNSVPTGVTVSSANKSILMVVASVDAVTINVSAAFINGATWTAGNRTVHWVAVVTQAVGA